MRRGVLVLLMALAVLLAVLMVAVVALDSTPERESESSTRLTVGSSVTGSTTEEPVTRTAVPEQSPEDPMLGEMPDSDATVTLRMWPVPRAASQWLTAKVQLHSGPEVELLKKTVVGAPPDVVRAFQTAEFSTRNVSTPSTVLEVEIPVPSARDLYIVIGLRDADDLDGEPPIRGLASQITDSMRLTAGENRLVPINLAASHSIRGQLTGMRAVASVVILAMLEPAHDPLGLRSPHCFSVLHADAAGRFGWRGLPAGRVTLSYQSVIPGYPRVPRLVGVETGEKQWDVPGTDGLRVTVRDPILEMKLQADGRHLDRRFSVGLDSPAADETTRDHPLVDKRGLEAAEVEKLHFFVAGVGHFSHRWRDLQADERGHLLIPVPSRRGGILVRNTSARDSKWHISARPAHLPEFTFGHTGVKAVVGAEGWRLEGLKSGNYRLHWWRHDKMNKRADLARVVTVQDGRITDLSATPPVFRSTRIRVTNWDSIPSDLRPAYMTIGRIGCRPLREDPGAYTADLPIPLRRNTLATFSVQCVGASVTATDLVADEASGTLDVRFPLESFCIEVGVKPRFDGEVGFGIYHTIRLGIGNSNTWRRQLAPRPNGRFLLACTASDEPIHGFVTETHSATGEVILRGWVKLSGKREVVSLDPGGRWVQVEPGHGVELSDVLLIGPVPDHDKSMTAGFWFEIAKARRLWIPEGTQIVRVRQQDRTRDILTRDIGEQFVIPLLAPR